MSVVPPLQTIPVGVVVERSKGVTPLERFPLAAGERAHRRAGDAALDQARDDGDRATFFAGAAEIELYRTETANYRGNLANDGRPLCG